MNGICCQTNDLKGMPNISQSNVPDRLILGTKSGDAVQRAIDSLEHIEMMK